MGHNFVYILIFFRWDFFLVNLALHNFFDVLYFVARYCSFTTHLGVKPKPTVQHTYIVGVFGGTYRDVRSVTELS
jgi:hypothetical protein